MDTNAWLVELTKDTVTQVNDILVKDKSAFIKEYGCETDRVDQVKIEKAQNMIGTLKFFLDKTTKNMDAVMSDARTPLNEAAVPVPSKEE